MGFAAGLDFVPGKARYPCRALLAIHFLSDQIQSVPVTLLTKIRSNFGQQGSAGDPFASSFSSYLNATLLCQPQWRQIQKAINVANLSIYQSFINGTKNPLRLQQQENQLSFFSIRQMTPTAGNKFSFFLAGGEFFLKEHFLQL